MTTERLQALVDTGQVKAIGGTGEFEQVIAALKDCDEATIILRKDGKPHAVLVYAATDRHDEAVNRAVDLMTDLGLAH
jgi:hypothetical protein